jgi:hypothetical protein
MLQIIHGGDIMKITLMKLICIGILLIIIFFSGKWLHRSGKPYNSILLNVHKLIALGVGVFLIVVLMQSHRYLPLNTMTVVIAAITGVFYLITGITGGLVSTDLVLPSFMNIIHIYTPYFIFCLTVGTLYLLFTNR